MAKNPVLSDLPIVNSRYEAGDCLIVRVQDHLTAGQVLKVTRAVVKFAGAAVSVAVVNVLTTQVLLIKPDDKIILTPLPKMESAKKPGSANLDLAKVPFVAGDRLLIKSRNPNRQLVYDFFRNWVRGKDVEIFVEIAT